ncbi:MAG: hypothetical protein PSY12_14555 [bacterium]|nr:hypothetical protein [bacterium]
MRKNMAWVAAMVLTTAPALAGNTLIAPGARVLVAKSTLAVTPASEWNKLGARPGRNAERWTLDGDGLNAITFYGGIPDGTTLFREVDKRNRPLPKVSATMLMTDIPALLESSYRIALNTPLMTIDSVEPTRFAGTTGVRFTYSYTRQDSDVRRKGEARAAMIGGLLYMATYEAPLLYYFDRDIAAFRQIADSAAL